MAWLSLPNTPVKKAACGALLISVPLSAFYVYATWLAAAAHGTNALAEISTIAIGLLGITILSGVLGAIFRVLGLIFRLGKATWSQVGVLAMFCGICTVVLMIATGIGRNIENKAIRTIIVRGGPVITAIEQFQAKNGALPAGLDELVPDFIPAIPDTGVGAYPRYEYVRNPNPAKYDSNPWVLFVNVSAGNLMQDLLIYYPNQNYPANPVGRNVRKRGNWAIIGTPNSTNSDK